MTTNDATDRVLKYHPWLVKTAGQLADKYSAERDDCYQMLALKLCEGHTLDIAYRPPQALGVETAIRQVPPSTGASTLPGKTPCDSQSSTNGLSTGMLDRYSAKRLSAVVVWSYAKSDCKRQRCRTTNCF
jgi:hypothetical protein